MMILRFKQETICFVAALFFGELLLLAGCDVAAPNLKGMTLARAKKTIRAAGFKVGKIKYDEKATGTDGTVVAQVPVSRTRIERGSRINLTVAGPPPVVTPDLIGLDKEKAQAALRAAGLKLGEVTESYNASTPQGGVVSQAPAARSVTPKGSTVAVSLSKGPEPVAVPSVKDKTEADAIRLLESAGFKVTVEQKSDVAEKGMVIAQNPEGGEAQPGTVVAITVSSGIEMVKVPYVLQRYSSDAAAKLKAAGLTPKDVSIHGPSDVSTPTGPGIVYRQSPKAGSVVPRGTVVRIWWWWEMN
jgi:beta-lactam-binding protein with PASTA domain